MDMQPVRLTLKLLGGFGLTDGAGNEIEVVGRKLQALLALLALSPSGSISRERLTGLLWADSPEENARASLRQCKAELRRLLGDHQVISGDRVNVTLDRRLVGVDVITFERLAKAGDLAGAAGCWSGQLLEGMDLDNTAFDSWMITERTRLNTLALAVFIRLLDQQSGREWFDTAEKLLRLEPAHEETHRALMRRYAENGDRIQAMRQYQICRDRLMSELGVSPEPETEALYRSLSTDSVDKSLPPTTLANTPAPVSGRREVRWRPNWIIAAAAVALVLLAAASAKLLHYRTEPANAYPTVLVLPFKDLGTGDGYSSLADGMTEDTIGVLARSPDLAVIARTTSMAYKGKDLDVRQIGNDLNVGYVLEGSVQRDADKVRVQAKLIDTKTGIHIWADRYDKTGADPLAIQDEIAARIVATLGGEKGSMVQAQYQAAWGKDQASLEEYDYYVRGHSEFFKFEAGALEEAGRIWREGLVRFPHSALLKIKLAWYHYSRMNWGIVPWNPTDIGESRRLLSEGMSEPTITPLGKRLGHWLAAYHATYVDHDFDRMIKETEAAYALAPYDAFMLGDIAEFWIVDGNYAKALEWLDLAIARDPGAAPITLYGFKGWALLTAGRTEEALEALNKVQNTYFYTPVFRSIAYVRLGRLNEAREQLNAAKKMAPALSVAFWRQASIYRKSSMVEQEITDLKSAGLDGD